MSSAADRRTAPAVEAVDFRSRAIYRSSRHPGYTSWVSFFPGERGQWYVTCEEATRPDPPLPRCSREQWYEMGLPSGYDKSQHRIEVVMLESDDGLATWREIARHAVHHHHAGYSFAQARTRDGRFLWLTAGAYSLDASSAANEILSESCDDGKTWRKRAAFHDPRFASFPHRMRTLRDGTLVVAVPLVPRWGRGTDRPVRTAMNLDAVAEMQLMLYASRDDGASWTGPLPIFAGQNVSETDFVELPDGDLLFVNSSIFARPGRQLVHRWGGQLTPGPMEVAVGADGFPGHGRGVVPETVCLADDGILVGCMRDGLYCWSDDLGRSWFRLDGAPSDTHEVYQPWIQHLGDGRIACVGHCGADDPISGPGVRDQYIALHEFRLKANRRTRRTRIGIERDFDEASHRWLNRYTLTLTCDGEPVPDRELEFWYAERTDPPAYDPWNARPLAERMKFGGTLLKVRTDRAGTARVALPRFDDREALAARTLPYAAIHHSYQLVVGFNRDRSDPDYAPAQSPQLEFYAIADYVP